VWPLGREVLSAKPLTVAVVGVGGTGSEVVSNLIHLHLGMQALGHGGLHVVAFDPDVVTQANIVRQRYTPADIGRSKSETLINRCNFAYALGWQAVPERFDSGYARRGWDVVISCVDTRKARKQIHGYAHSGFGPFKFWMDCGNDRTTGQVILGTPRGKKQPLKNGLPCATDIHPELMDTTRRDDTSPSCSAIEALKRQDLMVNKMVATLAVDLLWRLFRDRQIESHGRYFDLERGTTAALPIPVRIRKGDGNAAAGVDEIAARRRKKTSGKATRRVA